MIAINNPVLSTWIIGLVLLCLLAFSAQPKKPGQLFSLAVTSELKGLAILMVVFGHIGFSLSNNPKFLWPLSIYAGVGVNLFLFLSAYGLCISNMKNQLSIMEWYKKRLTKLYVSLWIVLTIFFLMDYFILGRSYPITYIWHSMIGLFPHADLYKDVDSVLWYFTILLFYYLLFPLLYIRRHLWLTSIVLFISGCIVINLRLVSSPHLFRLYGVHFVAFPLGVLVAWAFSIKKSGKLKQMFSAMVNESILNLSNITGKAVQHFISYYSVMISIILLVFYFSMHSGIGQSALKEQSISLITMSLIIILFIMKKVEFKLLILFGVFSYAIYLIHWPLLSRYDVFYSNLPEWFATLLWLGIFILLGWLLSLVSGNFKQKQSQKSTRV